MSSGGGGDAGGGSCRETGQQEGREHSISWAMIPYVDLICLIIPFKVLKIFSEA